MPYHPDSTTRVLFIKDHIHTPATLQEVICSICRQRCTNRHDVAQITAHPECQCVFGRTCLLQWLRSNSAASSTCPSCRAVLYNAKVDRLEGSDSGEDGDDDSEEDGAGDEDMRGRQRTGQEKGGRTLRGRARSPGSPRSPSSSSSDSFDTPPHHSRELRSHRHRHHSPFSSSSSSRTLSTSAITDVAIDTLVSDLWAGTWDLVTESWSLSPADATRSRSITRAQFIMLVHDVNPFEEELENAVVEHLVIRARKMVMKHRRNRQFDDEAELRSEREDVRLAVGYGL